MQNDADAAYPAGLTPEQAQRLIEVTGAGLAALRGYLTEGRAVAFLGAGLQRRCIRCGQG